MGMLGVIETQAADGTDIGVGEGGEEQADVCYLVRDGVGVEDVTGYDARLGGFGYVGCGGGEDGVAIVGAAVAGEEADEALRGVRCFDVR